MLQTQGRKVAAFSNPASFPLVTQYVRLTKGRHAGLLKGAALSPIGYAL